MRVASCAMVDWERLISSLCIEDDPYFTELTNTLQRVHWRLIKREQRAKMRFSGYTDVLVGACDNNYEGIEWEAVLNQLPHVEAQIAILAFIHNYTEREVAALLRYSQPYVHRVKKQVAIRLRDTFRE